MIARQEKRVALFHTGLVDGLDGGVSGLAALDRGFVDAGMADHVGGGKVVHQKPVFVVLDAFDELVRDRLGGHVRLEVVGGYLGGGNEVAVLEGELLLDAAVEEEGHVGVLLGLGDVALRDGCLAQRFGEDVAHVLRDEGDGEGVFGVVGRHGGEGDVFRVREIRFGGAVDVAEELGDLADAVGAVVEEEEGVVVLDAGVGAVDDDGFQEFVVLAGGVAGFDRGGRVAAFFAFARNHAFHADFDTVPPLVSVHDVVPADHGGELRFAAHRGDLSKEVAHVAGPGFGVGIAAVAEEMDEYFGDGHFFGDLQEGIEVVDVTVNAAIADQSQEVQSSVSINGALEGVGQCLDLVQFPFLDRLVDPHDVLPYYSTGANVQVTDFAVTHQSFGEADSKGGGIESGVALGGLAIFRREGIHRGGFSGSDGIAIFGGGGRRNTPTVNDDCSSSQLRFDQYIRSVNDLTQDGFVIHLCHARGLCSGKSISCGCLRIVRVVPIPPSRRLTIFL